MNSKTFCWSEKMMDSVIKFENNFTRERRLKLRQGPSSIIKIGNFSHFEQQPSINLVSRDAGKRAQEQKGAKSNLIIVKAFNINAVWLYLWLFLSRFAYQSHYSRPFPPQQLDLELQSKTSSTIAQLQWRERESNDVGWKEENKSVV